MLRYNVLNNALHNRFDTHWENPKRSTRNNVLLRLSNFFCIEGLQASLDYVHVEKFMKSIHCKDIAWVYKLFTIATICYRCTQSIRFFGILQLYGLRFILSFLLFNFYDLFSQRIWLVKEQRLFKFTFYILELRIYLQCIYYICNHSTLNSVILASYLLSFPIISILYLNC